jgi:SAM-dependent methyltransferase
LLETTGFGAYGLVLSVMTLHHVPDLQAALANIKELLAPGGRIVLVDPYPAQAGLQRLVPLRPRLHAGAVMRLATNLARGRATAWEIYRLSTRREWLDHRVSDRFFSPEEREQCCATLFPGCRMDRLGGTVIGLTLGQQFLSRGAAAQAARLPGGLWLCRVRRPSGLTAVTVASGWSVMVQPHW